MLANTSALAAGRRHSVGRRWDGTVVAVGNNAAGECRVGRWEDVVAVAAGNVHTAANTGRSHTVGLRSDGTVLARDGTATASAMSPHGETSKPWPQAGAARSGLLADGTVLAAGRNSEGTVRRAVLARDRGPVLRRLAFGRRPGGRFSTGRRKQSPWTVRRR